MSSTNREKDPGYLSALRLHGITGHLSQCGREAKYCIEDAASDDFSWWQRRRNHLLRAEYIISAGLRSYRPGGAQHERVRAVCGAMTRVGARGRYECHTVIEPLYRSEMSEEDVRELYAVGICAQIWAESHLDGARALIVLDSDQGVKQVNECIRTVESGRRALDTANAAESTDERYKVSRSAHASRPDDAAAALRKPPMEHGERDDVYMARMKLWDVIASVKCSLLAVKEEAVVGGGVLAALADSAEAEDEPEPDYDVMRNYLAKVLGTKPTLYAHIKYEPGAGKPAKFIQRKV